MQIEPMMKAGSSRGKQGAVVHGIDVAGKIYSQTEYLINTWASKAMCGTSCGPRSAGWAHIPKEEINCERCKKAIERLSKSDKQKGLA